VLGAVPRTGPRTPVCVARSRRSREYPFGPMLQRMLRVLDSVFLARVGRAGTLIRVIGLGVLLAIGVALATAEVVRVTGWIPAVCFAVWAVVSTGLVAATLLRRQPNTLTSPAGRVAIARGLPGAEAALLAALTTAAAQGREFIADAALVETLNDHPAAPDLAARYAAHLGEVAALIASSDRLDERWSALWAREPDCTRGHVGGLLEHPFYGEKQDALVQYMALQTRRLDGMIAYLQIGDDRPVRYMRRANVPVADAAS